MRATTAFNRLLRIPGANVREVRFGAEGVVVGVALRRRRRICSGCGQLVGSTHDTARRRWRHLDLGAVRCHLECELRRVNCPDCGVRVEAVPFARTGARHTRDFEDVVAWLAQQMAKAPIARLMRVHWETVGRIVCRVVADRLDESRLAGLVAIGVDEVSWRRHHNYLTVVADHRTGGVIWVAEGRRIASLQGFFEHLGERKQTIRAVSLDMSGAYRQAIGEALPDAALCFDPFHVVKHASEAVELVRRAEWQAKGRSKTKAGRWVKGTRWALLKAPERHSEREAALLAEVQRANERLYRAFLLKEELRALYHEVPPQQAEAHLDAWLAWASRSKLAPFVKLARKLRGHREGVLAAVRLGLSNGRLEGLNSKVRLISHRSFGFHSPAALIALIYLCCGGIEIDLPLT